MAETGERLEALKAEIIVLAHTEPERDFTPEQTRFWLESLRNAPDAKTLKLLVEWLDVETDESGAEDDGENSKTAFSIQSTLKAVLCKNGCGGSQHRLPTILFFFRKLKERTAI